MSEDLFVKHDRALGTVFVQLKEAREMIDSLKTELAKHEKCIEEDREAFNQSLEQCLDRAEKAETGVKELRDRMLHLARGFRQGEWEKQAELIEAIVRLSDQGTPVVTILAEERDIADKRIHLAKVAAEKFFQHHGHHPDESCCDDCEPLKHALWGVL